MARGERYDEYDARIRVPKGTKLDQSKDTPGAHRALARDASGNLVGQAEILDLQKPVKRRPNPSPQQERVAESAIESAPDISGLVPLALVAVAGIAVGVAGIRVAQNAKKKRQDARAQVELSSAASANAAPAGWYEVAGDSTRLRYWTGFAWTDDYAQRAVSAPQIEADWYPDPSNAAQLRYWDGTSWTHHVSPAPGVVTTPADWYPDPSNSTQLRYWDGRSWTSHVASGPAADAGLHQGHAVPGGSELAPACPESKVNMSRAEWEAHVEAWLRVGAVHQELWRRLSNAHIEDADAATLEAQRRMEALTPEEGIRRIKLMLEANPALREQGSLVDLMRLFDVASEEPLRIEMNQRRDRSR